MSAAKLSGPPYPPQTAAIGGQPTVGVDVPITSVFLFLFLCGAVGNMTIFQLNRRRGHKFLFSGMLFGFCMARIVTMIMRIVWACYPEDVRIGIAAMIFVSAGVLILFLVNLVFAQRILRAAHPHFGWKKTLTIIFDILYVGILAMLAMVITATVQSFYTLNRNTHRIDRDLQMTASTYLLMIAFLPIPMVILGILVPRKTRLEKFGTGRWRTKIAILLTTSVLLCLGAAFRSGTTYKNPRTRDDPAWYDAKWCFYFFNFTLEIIVVYLYIILRVDLRFHVPNGSKGPGDYVPENRPHKEVESMQESRRSSGVSRVMSEEEVFDDETPVDTRAEKDVEGQMGSAQ
ncbi:hypothetical protein LTR10_018383 [Elasticomyces elasticus]|uniref:G-protein coupled receptors family 1 profile domain-containing protein n=1 Tax=Exophiala sideris TaxID=1016849 RepID=A0ABR0J040_9EURO|nr:hypothetical protein LTR10_018383 [Elasticomyces elasticus]KAK5023174.1 hypothetical protein LTS07_009396 [Exophiala sideris]KAK5028546.1 hypothetical protein LTR13_008997 [Exophiala sideris]KAK5052924.1 hypothetical protein LTR69_009493 [Exophiala sideris]KAK5178664.1 hypothetical protein LTR44_008778 [Eurotiomycetes sp. CCFEE 6388]